MSATIHELPAVRSRRLAAKTAPDHPLLDAADRFVFWRGVSGAAYVHTVYSLIGCPEIAAANYLLVRRLPDGGRRVLKIGRVSHDAPSMNLAELRHVGANLCADEVHVHLLAESPLHARRIELDLRAAEMPEPVAANIPRATRSQHRH